MSLVACIHRAHTGRASLKALAAGLAAQVAQAQLLVNLHSDGALMVAEDAFELRRKRFFLYNNVSERSARPLAQR